MLRKKNVQERETETAKGKYIGQEIRARKRHRGS